MLSLKSRYGEIVKPSIKLAVSLILLGVIASISASVLGLIPVNSFVVLASTEMGMGIITISLVLLFGQQIANGLRNRWKSNPELFEITYNLIQVLPVVIAYVSFQKIVYFVFPGWLWVYSVTLFALALIPVTRASVKLITNIDKWFDKS